MAWPRESARTHTHTPYSQFYLYIAAIAVCIKKIAIVFLLLLTLLSKWLLSAALSHTVFFGVFSLLPWCCCCFDIELASYILLIRFNGRITRKNTGGNLLFFAPFPCRCFANKVKCE